MTGIISALSWAIAHWSEIVGGFNAIATVSLFFMHGNAKAELQEVKDFLGSVHVQQDPQLSAKENAALANPKI